MLNLHLIHNDQTIWPVFKLSALYPCGYEIKNMCQRIQPFPRKYLTHANPLRVSLGRSGARSRLSLWPESCKRRCRVLEVSGSPVCFFCTQTTVIQPLLQRTIWPLGLQLGRLRDADLEEKMAFFSFVLSLHSTHKSVTAISQLLHLPVFPNC